MKITSTGVGLILLGGCLGAGGFGALEIALPKINCLINPVPCRISPPSDTPVTGHGGSFSLYGDGTWTVAGDLYSAYTDLTVNNTAETPNLLSLDGVYPWPIVAGGTTKLREVPIVPDGNWAIVLDYRLKDESEDSTTTLKICTQPDAKKEFGCVVDNTTLTSTSTRIYLISSPITNPDGSTSPSGTFRVESIDRRNGTIFYDVNQCLNDPPHPHPKCDHPFKLTVHAFVNGTKTDQDYRCVDGACVIAFDHQ